MTFIINTLQKESEITCLFIFREIWMTSFGVLFRQTIVQINTLADGWTDQ